MGKHLHGLPAPRLFLMKNRQPDLLAPFSGIIILLAGSAVAVTAVSGLLAHIPVLVITGVVLMWTAKALMGK